MPTPIDRDELQRLLRDEQAQLVEVPPHDEYDDEHLDLLPAGVDRLGRVFS